MYYVIESPKVINVPISDIGHVKFIKANKDNLFMCAITSNDIMIWYCNSNLLIAFHQRADNSISIHGENHSVEWNGDSTKIAVMKPKIKSIKTSKGYIIYYKIIYENEFVITDSSSAQNACLKLDQKI
ncbi:guanine nucleotide exchange factor subunit Rich [Brachionus plicatilis]|uniref:Guanine nucleotide exchange factor subunit Rich n=1 Tax=Brachionus plicatilis TaxID=10195 RepID=A0A3M7QXM9_BRAPC|nr:guanine nucleotide exchange factor subunit Rich [Brachionus plicatilis]